MRKAFSRLRQYLGATPRRRRLSWTALVLFVFWILFSLFAWLAGPGLMRDYAIAFVQEEFGHELAIDEIKVNPLSLAVTVNELSLRSPDGQPLVTFSRMLVDVDVQTLLRGMVVLDEFRLDGLVVSVERTGPDRFNFSDFAERLAARAEAEAAATPAAASADDDVAVQFLVRYTELSNAAFHFVDHTRVPKFENWVRPINLAMDDLSSRPDSEAPYNIRATIGSGGSIGWKGDLTLQPLRSKGRLELSNFGLQVVHEYLQSQFAFALLSGRMQVQVDYLADFSGTQSVLQITDGETSIDDLQVTDPAGRPLFAFTRTRAAGIVADLIESTASIALFETLGGRVEVELDANGETNLQRALLPPPGAVVAEAPVAAAETPADAPAAAPAADEENVDWKISLAKAAIRDYQLHVVDHSVTPAAEFTLNPVSAEVSNVRFPDPVPLPFSLQATMVTGGSLALQGEYRLDNGDVRADIQVEDLALQPVTPYLGEAGRFSITDGRAYWRGKVSAAENGTANLLAEGSGGVRQLSLRDDVSKTRFLRLGELGIEGLRYDDRQARLALKRLLVAGVQLDVVRDREGITNLERVFLADEDLAKLAAEAGSGGDVIAESAAVETAVAENGEAAGSETAASGEKAPAPEMKLRLDSLVLRDNQFSFRDDSLDLPFVMQVSGFGGRIDGLSTDPAARAVVDLSGTIDRYAPLTIKGAINPLAAESFADVQLGLSSLDLVALTPYTVTYIAYPLERGKFGFAADWKIQNMRFESKNRMSIDGLALGERQPAERATKLPVKLGIALLTDRNGDADIKVPAYGKLDDPKFRIGRVILMALGNLVVKAATSPFAMLGMGGNGSADGGKLAFLPGTTQPAENEAQKFTQVGQLLLDKPMLSLGITGTASTGSDRLALKQAAVDLELRKQYLDSPFRRGKSVDEVELTPAQRADALEVVYRRMTGESLSSLRDAAGQPVAEAQRLQAGEQKLVELVAIDEGALRELARQRAQFAKDQLLAAGVPEAQLFVRDGDILKEDVAPVPTIFSLDAK